MTERGLGRLTIGLSLRVNTVLTFITIQWLACLTIICCVQFNFTMADRNEFKRFITVLILVRYDWYGCFTMRFCV